MTVENLTALGDPTIKPSRADELLDEPPVIREKTLCERFAKPVVMLAGFVGFLALLCRRK